jgi:TPR repeat protein
MWAQGQGGPRDEARAYFWIYAAAVAGGDERMFRVAARVGRSLGHEQRVRLRERVARREFADSATPAPRT